MELNEFLQSKVSSVEKMRVSFKLLQFLYTIIIVPLRMIVYVAMGVCIVITFFVPPFGLWAFASFIVHAILSSINHPRKVYESRIKNKIIPTIIEKTDPHLKYYPYHVNYETIKNSGLFKKSFFNSHTELTGDDLIEGKVGTVDVEFGEICFKKEYTNWFKTIMLFVFAIIAIPFIIIKQIFSGGANDYQDDELPIGLVKEIKIFYQGMYMSADFHKHFEGQVLLMPKNLENLKDKLDDYFFGTTFKKINVENPLIQEAYNVLCTNEQTAFYVLSPAIIQAIEFLYQQEKKWPVVSFQNGNIFLTIPNSKNYFSANLKTKVKDETYFTRYIDELHSLKKMVTDFNLDTRIWTKL